MDPYDCSAVVYDTETTGLPLWNEPSESPDQPHVVQYAGILIDAEGKELKRYEAIVKPNGWTIPPETTEIHGITNERAMDEGIHESEALLGFLSLWGEAGLRVGFNEMFDRRMIRIAIKRHGYGYQINPDQADRDRQSDHWNASPDFCCMWAAKYDWGVGKVPKLSAALTLYGLGDQTGAHTAMGDALDTLAIFRLQRARRRVPPLAEIIATKQAKADAKAGIRG